MFIYLIALQITHLQNVCTLYIGIYFFEFHKEDTIGYTDIQIRLARVVLYKRIQQQTGADMT